MKLLEYQAKDIFKKYEINVPKSFLVKDLNEIEDVMLELKDKAVLKAQVLAGGRGKAGGVKLVDSVRRAKEDAKKLLHKNLVTHQTDENGEFVHSLLFEEQIDIEKEFYLSILNDREKQKTVFIISAEGGTEIEEIAEKTPEKINKVWVDNEIGLKEFHIRKLFLTLNLKKSLYKEFYFMINKIYKIYKEKDASLIEINPLILTKKEQIVALDAKIKIDDNALFRQKQLEKIRVVAENEKEEIEAKEKGLSFVNLDGDVGCMVNGAGLAMATMDIVKHFGMKPANFLDVGGSSNPQKVINALDFITRNDNLKAIFINIFGGITRCDDVANGFKKALQEMDINVPIVIRLTGTNEKEGKKILEDLGHNVYTDLEEAVLKLKETYQNL